MLDPPISNADVDDCTLFKLDDGCISTARHCGGRGNCYIIGGHHYNCMGGPGISRASPSSLPKIIARIPKEKKSMSQVVCIDERGIGPAVDYHKVSFNSLFESNGSVYLKLTESSAVRVSGNDGPSLSQFNPSNVVRTRPDLRLELTLKSTEVV